MTDKGMAVGVIGAGNMGEAIIAAMVKTGIRSAGDIMVCDIAQDRTQLLNETYGVAIVENNSYLIAQCDTVLIAVKPQQLTRVLTEALDTVDLSAFSGRKCFVSIAAGITIERLESIIYGQLQEADRARFPIVRVMPNTPSLVLAGTAGISGNPYAGPDDVAAVSDIFSAMGAVIAVDEAEMDAVTAISGSGPAYVFYFIEAMIEAGLSLGLDPETATQLTVNTFTGALKLLRERSDTPASLRRKVTSPGGTTEAALTVMQNNQVKELILEAIKAAADRSAALSA